RRPAAADRMGRDAPRVRARGLLAALALAAERRAAPGHRIRRPRRAALRAVAGRDGLLGSVGAALRRGGARDDRARRLHPSLVGVRLVLLQARARPLADGGGHAGGERQRPRPLRRRVHRVGRTLALRGHHGDGRRPAVHHGRSAAHPPQRRDRNDRHPHQPAVRLPRPPGRAGPAVRRAPRRRHRVLDDRPARRYGRAAPRLGRRVLLLRGLRDALQGPPRLRAAGRGDAGLLRHHRRVASPAPPASRGGFADRPPHLRVRVRPQSARERAMLFLLLWFLIGFAVFAFSATKFHHYALPVLAPLLFFCALWVERLLAEGLWANAGPIFAGALLYALVAHDLA